MGLESLLHEPTLTDEQIELRSQFFAATGYGPSDLLSVNYSTHEFLTTNGGRYIFSLGKIEHVAGPSPTMEDRWEF